MDTSKVMEQPNTDALQIFEYCGAGSTQKLHVDALMDKFAPFINTKKAEYSYLRSLLDPEKSNPEICVTKLAKALNNYSETQKTKDHDESFNLITGHAPQDSDSGISTDGFQIEELQCELKEKTHLASNLRRQLDFSDLQHEEVVATLTAERDSLQSHINMLREENLTLLHVRRDYEDVCERLSGSEESLAGAQRDLEALRRQTRAQQDEIEALYAEKLSLQELLSKSKADCHKINDMYSSRQAALIEQNETLRSEFADVSSRLQDQEEFMQQIIKEKVLIEMELKDMVNKSNSKLDRTIDVSFTDDQTLSTLDSIGPDTKFNQDHLLNEEVFLKTLKEDHARVSNLSLYDEIRLSFGDYSHFDTAGDESVLEKTNVNACVQTENNCISINNNVYNCSCKDHLICENCDSLVEYTKRLEKDLDVMRSDKRSKLDGYEMYLNGLRRDMERTNDDNESLRSLVANLRGKLSVLEAACQKQGERLDRLLSAEKNSVHCQAEIVHCSVCTQTEEARVCDEKDERCTKCHAGPRDWRTLFWDALKSLFQLFACLCFCAALVVLYGATRARSGHCASVPARWLAARELLDAILRVQYVGEVPM